MSDAQPRADDEGPCNTGPLGAHGFAAAIRQIVDPLDECDDLSELLDRVERMLALRRRARTVAEKHEVLQRIEREWQLRPTLRLGQLLLAAPGNVALFWREDFDLATAVAAVPK